ncbi:hypothetical protein DKT77_17695, partial [Meridianimarinicoccus roseus]
MTAMDAVDRAGLPLGAELARQLARSLRDTGRATRSRAVFDAPPEDDDLAELFGATATQAADDAPGCERADGPGRLGRAEILERLDALRIGRLFNAPADLAGLAEGGSHTELIVAPGDDPVRVADTLATLLPHLDGITGRVFGLSGVEIAHGDRPAESRRRNRAQEREESALAVRLARLIGMGRAVIAVLPPGSDPGQLAQATRRARLALPPVSAEILADLVALVFPGADGAAPEMDLPADADLARLDPTLLAAAMAAKSAQEAAQRLHRYTHRLRQSRQARQTRLSDMALTPQVRAPLERMVRDVARWQAGGLDWAETTRSALLWGPPGTGKTMLAGALAGTMGVPLIATSYTACQAAGHLGDYLAAMHGAVDAAIARAPSVFFLDEFDSFGRRSTGDHGGHYTRQVVNDMLQQLTRLHDAPGVVVLAATNAPELVDPALRRAGRFDLTLEIGPPDLAGLRAILAAHLGAAAPDAKALIEAARALLGQTGATAAAVAREALGLARDDTAPIGPAHLAAATARHAPALPPGDLWRMAVHEAGHILLAAARVLPMPKRVTIGATGGAAELPMPRFLTAEATLDWTAMLLGGRAAEHVLLGAASSAAGAGEGSDLDRATDLLVRMELEWGLGDCGLLHAPVPPDRRAWLPDALRHKVSVLL